MVVFRLFSSLPWIRTQKLDFVFINFSLELRRTRRLVLDIRTDRTFYTKNVLTYNLESYDVMKIVNSRF